MPLSNITCAFYADTEEARIKENDEKDGKGSDECAAHENTILLNDFRRI